MTGLLFLCVRNSARSQMAEGLARGAFRRRRARAKRRFATGRSQFARGRRDGGDSDRISAQTSKSVESIDPHSVDTVITLCAERYARSS